MKSDILEMNGLSIDLLKRLSYHSKLGISLRRTLQRFDRAVLMRELEDMTDWLDIQEILANIAIDYRIKSMESIASKYDRYLSSPKQFREVFDDVLGFRAFCNDYQAVLSLDISAFRVADMSAGKAEDDGYRGVHVYYQAMSDCYPIEIQFNTFYDRQCNNWLHEYLYKKPIPFAVGGQLRKEYEQGKILNEEDFRRRLDDVLSGSKRCE